MKHTLPPAQPRTKPASFRLSVDLTKDLRRLAKASNVDLTALVAHALSEYVAAVDGTKVAAKRRRR